MNVRPMTIIDNPCTDTLSNGVPEPDSPLKNGIAAAKAKRRTKRTLKAERLFLVGTA